MTLKNSPKIALIGNYGVENRGDELILESILNEHPENEYLVFSSNPQKTLSKYSSIDSCYHFPTGLRSFLRGSFIDTFLRLRNCDGVVFGGGGLFQDSDRMAPFIWSIQLFFARILKKPLFVYATGVGPLHSKLSQWITKISYNYADHVTVRDPESLKVLETIGVDFTNVQSFCDPVFHYSSLQFQTAHLDDYYVLSLRPHKNFSKDSVDQLALFVHYLLAKKQARICFLSMQENMDRVLLEELKSRFSHCSRIEVFHPQTNQALIQKLQFAKFVISMRLHAIIPSTLLGVPVIALSYSDKVLNFMRSLDLHDYTIPLESISFDLLLEKSVNISQNYCDYQKKLYHQVLHKKKCAKELSSLANSWFQGLV